MLYWNVCNKSLDRCFVQLKLIWPNQLPPMMLISFLTTRHGKFVLLIIQYLKPHQVQPFLEETCSLTLRSWLTGIKLENTGNHWLILAISAKNDQHIDYYYKVGDKVLAEKEGILCKAESKYDKEPWTITTDPTNGTIRIHCKIKLKRLNNWRIIPFTDKKVL